MEIEFSVDYSKDYQLFKSELNINGTSYRKKEALKFANGSNQEVYFERDPNNVHDKNAIKVMGVSKHLLGLSKNVGHIGYLPEDVSASIVKTGLLDSMKPILKRIWVSDNKVIVAVTIRILILKAKKSELDESYIPILDKERLEELKKEARELREMIKEDEHENDLKKKFGAKGLNDVSHLKEQLKEIEDELKQDKLNRAKLNKL